MPSPPRLGNLIMVLVPAGNVEERDVVRTAQQGCCIAVRRGLQPIHPLLLYGMFMPRDEMDPTNLRSKAMWWARRVSALWLCYPYVAEEVEIDPLTYDILMRNETQGFVPRRRGDKARVPVHKIRWTDADRYKVDRMTKEELGELLRCNIMPGLLRGGL
jgi:hypothetical protein